MARVPMNPDDALALVGVKRGNMRFVAAHIVSPLRKYLTAMGLPGAYVASMSRADWIACFNDTSNATIERHKGIAKANNQEGDAPDDDESPVAIVNNPPQPNRGGLEGAIEAIVLDVLSRRSPTLDVDAVTDIVRKELNGIAPRELIIRENNRADIKIDARLPLWFDRVLQLLKQGQNVCLVGPAGCGKTYIVRLLATALGCERHTIVSGSAGVSESAITGRLLPTGDNGRFEYTASEFVECYEKGNALICLDEIDAFDSNMLMIVNVPTANGHMYIPHRTHEPCVTRGENVYFLATANTYGTSANPVYSARNQLDAATLDRWLFVTVDYDTKFEESEAMARGLTANQCSKLWELRNKVRENQLRRVISTRAFLKAAAMVAIGDDWPTVMETLTAGWSKDEKAKVAIAA
jgi:cobaltochelatase CobS